MFSTLLLAIVVGSVAVVFLLFKPARGSPPVVWQIPFVGDLPLILLFNVNPVTLQARRSKQYGPIFKTWILGRRAVVVSTPEHVAKILGGEGTIVQSDWPASVKALLGPYGVTTLTGEAHASLRRVLNPAFRTSVLARSIPDIVDFAYEFCDRWVDAKVISGYAACKSFPFKVMAACLLSYKDEDTESKDFMALRQALTKWLRGLFSLPINIQGTAYYKAMQERKFLVEKMKEHAVKLLEKKGGSPGSETLADALVNLRSEGGEGYSLNAIGDILLNLFFAGHETTASVVLTLFRELPRHPDVMAQLRAEQDKVREEHGEEITAEALSAMDYADAVAKEALRYNIIVPFVFRSALKDFELGPYTIPKGMTLSVDLRTSIKTDPRWAHLQGLAAPDK
eukprot:jgi/Botrbrau1/23389/Bobra.0051s0036.2